MSRAFDPYTCLEEHEDYRAKPKSARHSAADDLAAYLHSIGLAASPVAEREPEGRYYLTTLLPTDVGSGYVRTYGAGYFYAGLFVDVVGFEPKVDRLYGSVEEVGTFLHMLLVRRDVEAALAVPQREPARKIPDPVA